MLTTEVVRKVQRIFGDSIDETVITQQDILDWMNEAQLKIARETDCTTTSDISALSTYANGVKALPTDWLKTKRVTYNGSALKLIQIEDLDAIVVDPTQVSAEPSFYYLFANQLRLYPYQSTALNIQHDYVSLPTYITTTANQMVIPISYHEDVVRYCLMRAHERNENYRGMEVAKASFDENAGLRKEESEGDDDFYVIRDDPGEKDYGYVW